MNGHDYLQISAIKVLDELGYSKGGGNISYCLVQSSVLVFGVQHFAQLGLPFVLMLVGTSSVVGIYLLLGGLLYDLVAL